MIITLYFYVSVRITMTTIFIQSCHHSVIDTLLYLYVILPISICFYVAKSSTSLCQNFDTIIRSILGMNLFGCKFCDKMPDGSVKCDRKNFDSLLWALVTVFQVITPSTLPPYSLIIPLLDLSKLSSYSLHAPSS